MNHLGLMSFCKVKVHLQGTLLEVDDWARR